MVYTPANWMKKARSVRGLEKIYYPIPESFIYLLLFLAVFSSQVRVR